MTKAERYADAYGMGIFRRHALFHGDGEAHYYERGRYLSFGSVFYGHHRWPSMCHWMVPGTFNIEED